MNTFEIDNLQFAVTKGGKLQWQCRNTAHPNAGVSEDRMEGLLLAEWIVGTFYPGEAIVLRALKGIEINGVIYADPHRD